MCDHWLIVLSLMLCDFDILCSVISAEDLCILI